MKIKLYYFVVYLGFLWGVGIAQGSTEESSLNKISDTLAVIDVNGTNVGVLVSAKGLVLIDPAISEESEQDFIRQVRGFSNSQFKYVLNTHSDPDHSSGNKIFSKHGVSVLSNGNAKFSPAYTELTFDAGLLIDLGSHEMRAFNAISHTHNDWIIHFPEENTIFTGDLFASEGHPQLYAGGFIGQKQAIDRILLLANEETRIVPGHGAIATIGDVRTYMTNITELYNRVRTLHESGSSIEQIQADAKYQEVMLRFNVNGDEGFLSLSGVNQFVPRLISSDFTAAQNISEDASQRILGRYALSDRSTIDVSLEDGRFYARKKGEFLFELIPQNDIRFHVRASLGGSAEFTANSKNTKIKRLELNVDGASYQAKKQRR